MESGVSDYSNISKFQSASVGEEDRRKLFYSLCLKYKLRIPRTHPGNNLVLHELYQ
jgi:hypothetical protein